MTTGICFMTQCSAFSSGQCPRHNSSCCALVFHAWGEKIFMQLGKKQPVSLMPLSMSRGHVCGARSLAGGTHIPMRTSLWRAGRAQTWSLGGGGPAETLLLVLQGPRPRAVTPTPVPEPAGRTWRRRCWGTSQPVCLTHPSTHPSPERCAHLPGQPRGLSGTHHARGEELPGSLREPGGGTRTHVCASAQGSARLQ